MHVARPEIEGAQHAVSHLLTRTHIVWSSLMKVKFVAPSILVSSVSITLPKSSRALSLTAPQGKAPARAPTGPSAGPQAHQFQAHPGTRARLDGGDLFTRA
jgi:hypothetical protein